MKQIGRQLRSVSVEKGSRGSLEGWERELGGRKRLGAMIMLRDCSFILLKCSSEVTLCRKDNSNCGMQVVELHDGRWMLVFDVGC